MIIKYEAATLQALPYYRLESLRQEMYRHLQDRPVTSPSYRIAQANLLLIDQMMVKSFRPKPLGR